MSYGKARGVAGAPLTISYTPVDSDGEPSGADPGTVTVTVTRSDGTAVATNAATSGAGVNPRTYQVTATSQLDQLTAAWSIAGVVVHRTMIDIVGGVYATLTEIRGVEDSLGDVGADQRADLIRARNEVEEMFERACGHVLSFVPRYSIRQSTVVGNAGAILPHAFVTAIRSVSYTDRLGAVVPVNIAGGFTIYPDRTFGLNTGWWPSCERILVGYEHGMTAPPDDVKRAAIHAVRRQANMARSGVDSRAISYQGPTGEIQRFPTPGLGPWVTGVPEIDEVLEWYREHYEGPGLA